MRVLDLVRGLFARPTPRQLLQLAQEQAPPPRSNGAPDDGARTLARIRPRLAPELQTRLDDERIVVGEIGLLSPNAMAEFAPPSGYVVRVHSGMSHFFHYIGRVLMGTWTLRNQTNRDDPSRPLRTTEEVTQVIARTCEALKRGETVPAPGDEGLPPDRLQLADALSDAAEDFILAHEFGHILTWLHRGGDPGDIQPEEEFEADLQALGIVLGFGAPWPVQERLDRRIAYAGAEFALRVFATLEHLSYPFESTHPLPGGRLRHLREIAAKVVGTRRRYLEISTIAFAFDQQLEQMERTVAGETKAAEFVLGLTVDRMLSTLTAILEEIVRGRLSFDFAVAEISAIFRSVPAGMLADAAAQAVQLYVTDGLAGAHLQNVQLRLAENEAFKQTIPRLDPVVRCAFEAALPAVEKKT